LIFWCSKKTGQKIGVSWDCWWRYWRNRRKFGIFYMKSFQYRKYQIFLAPTFSLARENGGASGVFSILKFFWLGFTKFMVYCRLYVSIILWLFSLIYAFVEVKWYPIFCLFLRLSSEFFSVQRHVIFRRKTNCYCYI